MCYSSHGGGCDVNVCVRKTLIVYHFSLHFHKMSLVLTSLHPSSLELRYLVPPCPGVSLGLLWCNERVCWLECACRQALRRSPWDAPRCGAERRLLARACRRLLNNGRVSREIPRSCQRIPQHLPISWAKTCPLRKILTNHRCINYAD